MRWAEAFPEEALAARSFIEKFRLCQDPVLAVSAKFKTVGERAAWTLLGTCLFQDLGYSSFSRLFAAISKKFPGPKLWALPVPSRSELFETAKEALGPVEWSLLEFFPGIFWSTGLFVRNHSPLEAYLPSRTEEELWRDLGEIYFMGKRANRPKACAAIFRLLAPKPLGLGLSCKASAKRAPLPLTMGARRFISFLGPLQGGEFKAMPEGGKQKIAGEFFRHLSPAEPELAAHSLQFFLEFGKKGYVCRDFLGSCGECPLSKLCPETEAGEL